MSRRSCTRPTVPTDGGQTGERHLAWLLNLNPFAVLLDLVRQPLLYGEFPFAKAVCLGA